MIQKRDTMQIYQKSDKMYYNNSREQCMSMEENCIAGSMVIFLKLQVIL